MKRTFAILAVSFVLLRPVCDVLAAESAHAAHEGGSHATLNGESHDDGSDTRCCVRSARIRR